MWRIDNHTPFGAEGTFARDHKGAEIWLVAVKASYLINPNGSLSIGEPTAPLFSPQFIGEPGKSGLKYDADLQLTKPGTDIILHGHAYAPTGKSVTQKRVTLKVGPMEKKLMVTGDRFWQRGPLGMKLTTPQPFEKMALTYENTFGGTDRSEMKAGFPRTFEENPLGTGFALKKENLSDQKAPNIEYLKNGRSKPACFAPISTDWNPRAIYGGTYDKTWLRQKAPLLPDDFDDRFYHCAPWDQQIPGHLKGGEMVEISGMSPRGLLKFKLPSPAFTFRSILGGKMKRHQAKLHTVIFEPDIPGFNMVWHTALNCHNQDHMLEKTIIT